MNQPADEQKRLAAAVTALAVTITELVNSRIESALRNGPSRIVPSSPSSSAERWLTKADVAERLQVSPRTIGNWLRLGYLPHVRVGRLVRFQMRDIENQMEARNKIFGRSGYRSRRAL